MNVTAMVLSALLLQASVAHADRDGFSVASQGRLTVVKSFSVSSNISGHQIANSLTLRPGTYDVGLANGSYYKSTLCDLLPYCTERWEKDPSYYGEISLLKKEDGSNYRKMVKRVKFATESARQAGENGALAELVSGQGIKIYRRSDVSEQWVNSQEALIQCTIKDRCWDAYGYHCSYLAGTASATVQDKVTVTKVTAKLVSTNGALLATYASSETQRETDIVTAQGECHPNRH